MRTLVCLLFALLMFTACDTHEDFEREVAVEVMPELEDSLDEDGFENNTCRLIDRELIPVVEDDGDTLYRGTVECSSTDIDRVVRAKLFVAKTDGEDGFAWEIQ